MKNFLKMLLVLNNYSHDFAAAFFLSSALILFLLKKELANPDIPKELKTKIFNILSKIGLISFFWIILAGIIRTYFFRSFELNESIKKGEVNILIFKHIIFFLITILGIFLWKRLRKEIYKSNLKAN